jgi:hypothetical protein
MKTLPFTKQLIADMRERIVYDSESGLLRWKDIGVNSFYRGKPIQFVNSKGYVAVRFQGNLYKAHRVAWALHYDQIPPQYLDHINRNKSDNRIVNLRVATISQNNCNTKIRKDNRTGHRGIYWHKPSKKWCAQIKANKKVIRQLFNNIQDAAVWADRKRKELHGEFAATA